MRGKTLIYLLLFILLVSIAIAYSEIQVNVLDNEIEFGEKATYRLVITNEAEGQTYTIASTPSIQWAVTSTPSSITLASNQTAGADIEVAPMQKLPAGIYLVALKIQTSRGESYEPKLKIYMGPAAPREYLPSITTSVDVNENVDPRETQSIKVFIQNQNPLEYKDLIITLKSDLDEFEKEQTIDLNPYESKTVEFAVTPNPHTQPKDYYLFFTLTRGEDEVIKTFDKKITIVSLTTDFVEDVTTEKSFLKTLTTIQFTNDGNVRNQQTAKVKTNALVDFFTSTNPDAYVLKDEQGSRYLAWDLELGVNESASVTLKTSYRIPAIILILVIIAALLYFFYKNPIQVTKAASNVIMHEGSVSGLKVTLVVKNLGNKMLKDVEVFDTAPSIASIEKDVEVGTLQPAEILRNRQGGILLKWKISELEAKEERLVSYKIKSKLDIVGTLHLPRAKVKFKSTRGKQRISYSNTYRVGGELEGKE